MGWQQNTKQPCVENALTKKNNLLTQPSQDLIEVRYLRSLKNIHFGVLEMIGFPNGIIDFGSLWTGVWACSRCCNFLENPPLRLNIGNKPHGWPRLPSSGPSNFLLAPYDSRDRLHTKKCKDLILNCYKFLPLFFGETSI